jgi:hypothetical protein
MKKKETKLMPDASSWDISSSYTVKRLQELAEEKGREIASGHYPYVVLSEERQLRAEAEGQCNKWWKTCYGYERHMDDIFPGVKRIYVAAFAGGYRKRVEEIEQAEAEKKAAARREAEKEKGARVDIRSQRQQPDGVRYLIDFFDPQRMTQAISFLVSVKDDGLV